MPLSPVLEDRVEEWEQTIDVNIKGVLYTIRAVLADMARRRDGHIVNVSSLAGRFAFAGGAVYSGIKFAVRAISDGLRREALAYGVRVTDIEPGAVATELAWMPTRRYGRDFGVRLPSENPGKTTESH